jgi:hypothetical protein
MNPEPLAKRSLSYTAFGIKPANLGYVTEAKFRPNRASPASFPNAILSIIFGSSRSYVIWIHTIRSIAIVTCMEMAERSKFLLKSPSMQKCEFLGNPELAVS